MRERQKRKLYKHHLLQIKMGHRQKMSDKQRLDWDVRNYKLRLAANKGHNHSYMTNEMWADLERKGYKAYLFGTARATTTESTAIEVRDMLRKENNYARIICSATRLRIREYQVYYKPKSNENPIRD